MTTDSEPLHRLLYRHCGRTVQVLAALTAALACNDPDGPQVGPTIAGIIVARDVTTATGGPPSIHVKENETAPCGIVFHLSTATVVRRQTGEGLVPASQADLVISTRVRVWARGGIRESCPAQGDASRVEIIP